MTVAIAHLTAALGGSSLELGSGSAIVQIGRDASCDLSISSIAVSRFHGRLTRAPHGEWVFQDQGSTNGSFVHGARVDAVAVTPGLVINLGGVHGDPLTFHFPGMEPLVHPTNAMAVHTPPALAYPTSGHPGLGFSQQGYVQPTQAPTMVVHAAPASQPDRSMSNGAIGAGLVAAGALLLGALGFLAMDKSTSLDVADVERTIEAGVRAQSGLDVSVDCPSEMIGEPGDDFRCLALSPYGRSFAVVHVESSKGDYTWETT